MILCLDYGERYIGVAISDIDTTIALRHSTVDQTRQDAFVYIRGIIMREGIRKILVGVPLSLQGRETQQTRLSRVFLGRLQAALSPEVDVESVDETLTSVEAESIIRDEGGAREDAHAEAARLMLAEYLRAL